MFPALPLVQEILARDLKFGPYTYKKRWKRIAAAVFDTFGALPAAPFLKKRRRETPAPEKILVLRLDSLGDGVLALPAIEALRQRFPSAKIDFLVSPAVQALYELLFPECQIHRFDKNWLRGDLHWAEWGRSLFQWSKKIKQEKYELGIDFRGDPRSILLMFLAGIPHRWARTGGGFGFLLTHGKSPTPGRHAVEENLGLIDSADRTVILRPEGPKDLRFFGLRPQNDEARDVPASNKFNFPPGKKIVIHAGAGYPSKRWPARDFVSLANHIVRESLGIPVFIGSKAEVRLFESVPEKLLSDCFNLIGETSFPELLSLLREADLFIGNDSGPAHLAAMLNRRGVILFSGTNRPQEWAPWSERMRIVSHAVPCSPCEEKNCPLRHHACMEEISMEQVLCTVKEMLRD